jgi:hypothetical protein
MGVAKRRHLRLNAVIGATSIPATCGNVLQQRLCRLARLVRIEVANRSPDEMSMFDREQSRSWAVQDPVHDFGACRDHGAQLMPVDQLGSRSTVVPG